MVNKGPALPNWLAAGIIGVAVGGPIGYFIRDASDKAPVPSASSTLQGMAAGRGGRGGGGGGRGGSGGSPGGSGGGRGGGGGGGGFGGGGGGGQQDPDKPFASERNKQALDDLLTQVQGKAK